MKNYFEHFGIPKAFNIDLNQLRKSFYKISRTLHPDHNPNHDVEQEVNQHNLAYDILCHPIQRLKYIIELEGFAQLIEKPLDPNFLMEMMELHEEIDSAVENNSSEKIIHLKTQLEQYEAQLVNSYSVAIEQYDNGEINDAILQSLVDFFVKLKYLRRLRKAFGVN